jgi:pimeloyl-ACP methyl ester carboxylesterase
MAAMFKRDIPNAETIIYPGVGHLPMVEVPEISARDAHRFLSQPVSV